jgi:AraC-like DNA-binding protein
MKGKKMDKKIFQIYYDEMNQTNLIFYHCGVENCFPGKSFGPWVRDHYLIHIVHKGKGIFSLGNRTYHLEAGQGFIICPDDSAYYQADAVDPWNYSWVGFNGSSAGVYLRQAGLGSDNPVFGCGEVEELKQLVDQMLDIRLCHDARELKLIGLLNLFLSKLIELNRKDAPEVSDNVDTKEAYAKKAVKYILTNYSRKISVTDIADHVGLDVSYMSMVFKRTMNIAPHEYLINWRLEKAIELMKNPALRLSEIACSVGYDDPFLFSKLFKKKTGLSPREYRKRQVDFAGSTENDMFYQ